MSYTPDTDGDAEDADHHQGDEHQDPLQYDWSIFNMQASDWSIGDMKVSDWSPYVSWCPGYPQSGART